MNAELHRHDALASELQLNGKEFTVDYEPITNMTNELSASCLRCVINRSTFSCVYRRERVRDEMILYSTGMASPMLFAFVTVTGWLVDSPKEYLLP